MKYIKKTKKNKRDLEICAEHEPGKQTSREDMPQPLNFEGTRNYGMAGRSEDETEKYQQ